MRPSPRDGSELHPPRTMSEAGAKSSQALASKGEKDAAEKRGRGRPRKKPQQEPSEAPTPKRPRGRPKGSKNKATPKGRDSNGLPSATARRTAAAGGTEPSSWMRPAEMGTIGTAARGPRRLPSAQIRLKMHRASPQKWDRGCDDATAERGVEREPPARSGGTTGQNAAGLC
ncbi:hypothetical protein LUU34_00664900 [Aix galericulata]|nr:hypothetical protein LUU34_00664900 [Aix galericulata]